MKVGKPVNPEQKLYNANNEPNESSDDLIYELERIHNNHTTIEYRSYKLLASISTKTYHLATTPNTCALSLTNLCTATTEQKTSYLTKHLKHYTFPLSIPTCPTVL